MGRLRQYRLVIVVAGSFLAGALVTSAVGDLTSGTGGAVTRVKVATGNDLEITQDSKWRPLPGAATFMAIPSSGGLITARFSSLSTCTSDSGGKCLVHIKAQKGTGIKFLNPAGDNTFDSAPGGAAASFTVAATHAIERSARLSSGVWKVSVEYTVFGQGTIFSLASWHLTVERS